MNKVLLFGRISSEVNLRQNQNGNNFCLFTVAVNRPKQQDGTQQTDFISCVAWGKTAEAIAKYFVKGKPIIVEGSLRNNNFTDKNNVQHYAYDVYVEKFEFTINDTQKQPQQAYQQYFQQPPQQQQYQPQPPQAVGGRKL